MSTPAERDGRISRRKLLAGAAAGAVTASQAGLGTAVAGKRHPHGRHPAAAVVERPDRFGRIFRLPAFAQASPALEAALLEIGKPGGILDAHDDLTRSPKDLIVDLSLSANNPNNPNHTAGVTFVGQFMDHDMTFDSGSPLGQKTRPESATNSRTPSFDLDSVYGAGPIAQPSLYDPADRAKLLIENGGLFEDVPRTQDGRAIIGDPRNDENVMVSGLHAAFLRFHNRAVDDLRSGGVSDVFQEYAQARQLTTWHYQWIIVHEILPLFVGPQLVGEILRHGRRHYRPKRGEAYIPVDFQGAAYRFGHSMVRPSYRANLAGDKGGPFFAMIFDPGQEGKPDPADLRGGFRAPRRFVGWQTFFDFRDGQVKPNKRIDTKISTPLFNLPLGVIPTGQAPTSLPQRNLLRHLTWSLPSGQSIAAHVGAPALHRNDLGELAGFGLGLDRHTPLWYYVLKEAEVMEQGLHLGPVGGRIVGEVIIGLLQADPGSYLAAAPHWKPTLPARSAGDFTMVDFLTYAGVDPASRKQ